MKISMMGALVALFALLAMPALAADRGYGQPGYGQGPGGGQPGPGWNRPAPVRYAEVRIALTFDGIATATDNSGRNLSVRGEARAPRDLDGAITRNKSSVRFDSLVATAQDGSFTEQGRLVFGGGELRFESAQRGRLGPSAAPGLQTGYAVWRVVDGTGVFKNASGYIVSNFTVGPKGAVKDSQVAVVLLRR